jgi:hypothetical protein
MISPNTSIGDKVLVTCDNWFYAPDGIMYRGVFGTVKAVRTAEDTLGIRPNGRSTNWYLEIGNMTIAGCQVHYVVKTDNVNCEAVDDASVVEGVVHRHNRPTQIYNADKE